MPPSNDFGKGWITEEILRDFARKCPELNKAISKRRYVLPKVRRDDYLNQDLANQHFKRMLLEWGLGKVKTFESTAVEVLNLIGAIRYDRPILYLERELGEKLMETDLPEDVATDEIHWPWPSFRIMLPKGLIGSPAYDGVPTFALYLDLTLWAKGEEIGLNRQYAVELSEMLDQDPEDLSALSMQEIGSGFYLSAMSDYQKPGYGPDVASCMGGWDNWKLRNMVASTGHVMQGQPREEVNRKFLEQCRFLMLNLLFFLSQEPLTVFPEHWLRKPRTEGKHQHLLPGLLPARFVSECLPKFRANPAVERRDYEPSGKTIAAHWVRGYWKRVVYGPGRALRRRQWIMPYRTGYAEASEGGVPFPEK